MEKTAANTRQVGVPRRGLVLENAINSLLDSSLYGEEPPKPSTAGRKESNDREEVSREALCRRRFVRQRFENRWIGNVDDVRKMQSTVVYSKPER